MSSSNEKKSGKGRAQAVAAWEWFKEAAWLQVLLIVGVVVGLVVSIPFVVKGIANAVSNDESSFFDEHRINYTQLNKYLDGSDKGANGYIGDGTLDADGKINFNNDLNGFSVIFYKSNCSNCDTLQKPLENWYKDFNKKYGDGKIKLYTIDISWDDDDDEDAAANEGTYNLYDNKYISLEQQNDVQAAIKNVYLDQDDVHKASSVTEEILNKDLTAETGGGTLPTPCMISYVKKSSDANYITNLDSYNADTKKDNVIQYTTPSMVLFGPQSGLSFSNAANVATIMMDLYHFQDWKGNN